MSTGHSVDSQSTHPTTTRLQRGFTLIELVIVLAVLGALAAIAVPQLTGLQDEAELAGTAAVVSSELSNEFARQLAADNVTAFQGTSNTICDGLDSLAPAISGDSSFSFDKTDDDGDVVLTVPSYNSGSGTVGSVECYLGTN